MFNLFKKKKFLLTMSIIFCVIFFFFFIYLFLVTAGFKTLTLKSLRQRCQTAANLHDHRVSKKDLRSLCVLEDVANITLSEDPKIIKIEHDYESWMDWSSSYHIVFENSTIHTSLLAQQPWGEEWISDTPQVSSHYFRKSDGSEFDIRPVGMSHYVKVGEHNSFDYKYGHKNQFYYGYGLLILNTEHNELFLTFGR